MFESQLEVVVGEVGWLAAAASLVPRERGTTYNAGRAERLRRRVLRTEVRGYVLQGEADAGGLMLPPVKLPGILTARRSGIMMLFVRTTVTLEPDVARLLNDQAKRTRKSFKETLNDAVRLGLARVSGSPDAGEDFIVEARPMQLKAGVDAGRLNSLVDDLEAEAFIERAAVETRKRSGT